MSSEGITPNAHLQLCHHRQHVAGETSRSRPCTYLLREVPAVGITPDAINDSNAMIANPACGDGGDWTTAMSLHRSRDVNPEEALLALL